MIELKNVSKYYGEFKALDGLNLTIKKGEVFGLLGPNGAGKSTTIKILSTLLKGYKGSIFIKNQLLSEHLDSHKKIIGAVPQEISLYDELSAYDNLVFWGKLNGVKNSILKSKIDEYLTLIGLESRKNDLIKTYSGGMKRRINIAAALLHEPEILFMDEPTTGVDPQSRNKIFDIIEQLKNKGKTIIYTTHYMEEVERLCDSIAIIDSGKIIAYGTKDELQQQCNLNEYVHLKVEEQQEAKIAKLKAAESMPITVSANTITIKCNPHIHLSKLLNNCNSVQLKVLDISIEKSNLETIFLHLTGKQLRDN